MPEGVIAQVPKALYVLDGEAFEKIYGEEERESVAELADVYVPPECRRMGRLVVDELRRYVAEEPLEYEIIRERAALMA
jgi:hypothetical protein